MKLPYKIYSSLWAACGNWRNTIFIGCDCGNCMCGQTTLCSGSFLAVDECGQVMLLSAEDIQRPSGETADSSECTAVPSQRAFDAALSKYIEQHTPEPSVCALRQLSLDPGCN